MLIPLLFSFNMAMARPASLTGSWPQWAERMTGESDAVREQCLREIKTTPHLSDLLRSELRDPSQSSRTHMYLALDIISALKIHELLPDLIELSETEPSGYLYHTINTLVTPDTRLSIIDLYRQRVLSLRTSPAARMALLDTLARFGSALNPRDLDDLLKDPAADVRETALSYVRTFLIRRLHPDYLPLVKDQLAHGSFLMRVQAIYLLRELKPTLLPLGDWQVDCAADANETIRDLCRPGRKKS